MLGHRFNGQWPLTCVPVTSCKLLTIAMLDRRIERRGRTAWCPTNQGVPDRGDHEQTKTRTARETLTISCHMAATGSIICVTRV